MPEQTFRSPNFYDRESELSARRSQTAQGVPAGVVGTSRKGPAFVPYTVGNFDEFVDVFGGTDTKMPATYGVREFLRNRQALTFMKVLGAGVNASTDDILKTITKGQTKSAGFTVTGTVVAGQPTRHNGCVQFLVANHTFTASEAVGFPIFTDNDSFGASTGKMVRGMVMFPSGARMRVLDGDESAVSAFPGTEADTATLASGKFKLIISSSLGSSFATTDGNAGVKIYTASLDPSSKDYYAKILNTDPERFVQEQHLLYADFPVDYELATVATVGVASGTASTSTTSGDTSMTFRDAFGHFDSRYTTPTTQWIISQPYGNVEHDLFRFEALDDGEYANKLYKITISNVRKSADDANKYGSFTVQVRSWDDNDFNPSVLEQFAQCNLDPTSQNYVAKVIGDRKTFFNFDEVDEDERRLVTSGKYENKSKHVRIVMSQAVEDGFVPQDCMPFGFRGVKCLKTNDTATDGSVTTARLGCTPGSVTTLDQSILPPVPLRFKVTIGDTSLSAAWPGDPGATEIAAPALTWGVKFERNVDPVNPNTNVEKNELLASYTKFMGIEKLDVLVTGSHADVLNNNKFTLAKVAFPNTSVTHLTSTIEEHMRGAAYLRDGVPNASDYTINDGVLGARITFGTLASKTSSVEYNRFAAGFAKFTLPLGGGFDGNNILDKNSKRMNDKATSFDDDGAAEASYVSPGLLYNCNGTGQSNNAVYSYKTAVDIMTDPMIVNHNILVMPGIREPFLCDYAADKTKSYGLAMCIMDIPTYDESSNRLYEDSSTRPDVDKTANTFDGRTTDNSFAAAYFPDVYTLDATLQRRVKVPASVAALAAIGVNDRVGRPWFAPAGFTRGALDFVTNVVVRLSVPDRDRLQDVRINPIATFPREGFVIFGQKTLQLRKSALDRVNVRRLMLEIRRVVSNIALRKTFEQNTAGERAAFASSISFELGIIQVRAGIESFRVVVDSSNNTQDDIDLLRMKGRVEVKPTRAIENIAIDFVITNAGVEFV